MFVEHRAQGGKRNKNKKGKSWAKALRFYSYYYLCPLPYVQRTYGKAKAKGIKIRKARVPTLWDHRAKEVGPQAPFLFVPRYKIRAFALGRRPREGG